MIRVGKLCGLAVISVAIIPIILGMVWPSGTETEDVWDVGPALDVTGDLANRSVPIFETYTGPLNNSTIFRDTDNALSWPEPVDTTDVPNAYPIASPNAMYYAETVNLNGFLNTAYARVGIGGGQNGLRLSGDDGIYGYADYWVSSRTIILYDLSTVGPARVVAQEADMTVSAVSGSLAVQPYTLAEGEYMNIADGLLVSQGIAGWMNGFQNESVDFWVRLMHTPAARFAIDQLLITWNGSYIQVSDGTNTETLGSVYDFIQVRLTSSGVATIWGLVGVDSFADRTFSLGNSITMACSGRVDIVPIFGTNAKWWVVQAVSAIGATTGIMDSALDPRAYFGSDSWQIQIVNPSVFGDSLTVTMGSLSKTWMVSGGSVEFEGTDGEAHARPVRDLRILSLVEPVGTQLVRQSIYFDGIKVMQNAASDATLTFNGKWMASVVASKVTQSTQERYTWDWGTFGFDQTAFCVCGLASCLAVAVIGGLWGRRSGGTVLPLFMTLAVCGLAYFCVIP